MIPVLEASQALLSTTQNAPFDLSTSSSRLYTPVSSDLGDTSVDSQNRGGCIELRDITLSDFMEALSLLQGRVQLEGSSNSVVSSYDVCFESEM